MNVIVTIDGREAIPVRAIPLVSNWRFMSPDILAHVLGGTGGSNVALFGDLQSHQVEDSKVQPIAKDWWAQFPLKELRALSERIRTAEASEEAGYSEWRRQSLKELPAGVFVWKDDYQKLHEKNWNSRFSMNFSALRDWNTGGDSDEEIETQIQRELTRDDLVDGDSLRRDLTEGLQILKRWETPDYSPFMAADLRAVVMEGFGPVHAVPNDARATVAEQAEVDALLGRREEVKSEILYWSTRDDTRGEDAKIIKVELAPLCEELAMLTEKLRLLRGDYFGSHAAPNQVDIKAPPAPGPESESTERSGVAQPPVGVTIWTTERKDEARAMSARFRSEGKPNFRSLTAKHYGVSRQRLDAVLKETSLSTPVKKALPKNSIFDSPSRVNRIK